MSRFCVGASPHDWIELETGLGRHCWRCGLVKFIDGRHGGSLVSARKPKPKKKPKLRLPDPVRRRQTLLDRDGDLCVICSEPFTLADFPTIEHVIPVAHGGTSALSNLRLSHGRCNAERGVQPLKLAQ